MVLDESRGRSDNAISESTCSLHVLCDTEICCGWSPSGASRDEFEELSVSVSALKCVGLGAGRRHAAQCCELKESSELLTTAQPLGFVQRYFLHDVPASRV